MKDKLCQVVYDNCQKYWWLDCWFPAMNTTLKKSWSYADLGYFSDVSGSFPTVEMGVVLDDGSTTLSVNIPLEY